MVSYVTTEENLKTRNNICAKISNQTQQKTENAYWGNQKGNN